MHMTGEEIRRASPEELVSSYHLFYMVFQEEFQGYEKLSEEEAEAIRERKADILAWFRTAVFPESPASPSGPAAPDGLREIEQTYAAWLAYHEAYHRALVYRTPPPPLPALPSLGELFARYPRAAVLHRAQVWSCSADPKKAEAGARARERILRDDYAGALSCLESPMLRRPAAKSGPARCKAPRRCRERRL